METTEEQIKEARQKLKEKMGEDGAKIAGKGQKRRVKKLHHQTQITDSVKLKAVTKKFGVQPLYGIDEVNMFMDDGNILHFINPEVMASLQTNTFVIIGKQEIKTMKDLMPDILSQIGEKQFSQLQVLGKEKQEDNIEKVEEVQNQDDDVPELVGQNLQDSSNNAEIEKTYQCPYQNCGKHYATEVSLNLHIKLKHKGGNKTEREKYARQLLQVQSSNEKSQIKEELNLPPGYLEQIKQSEIKKITKPSGQETNSSQFSRNSSQEKQK